MSNKVGKTIENRVSWGRWLVASVDTHGARIAGQLDGRSGMDRAAWEVWFGGQRDEMHGANEALFGAEITLARERADDPGLRDERDAATAGLYDEVVRARSLLESVAAGEARRFGLDGQTPRSPTGLEAYARNAVEALREADETLGSLGVEVKTKVLADQLTPKTQMVSDKLVGMADEDRQAEALLVARDQELERWEQTYRAVAHMLQGAYHLAGESELADRVRPTVNRASGVEGPDDAVDTDTEPVEPVEPVEA